MTIPIPPHDDPSQAWRWTLRGRVAVDRNYALFSCRTASGDTLKLMLKSGISLNAMRDIAEGLALSAPEAIAAEIAARRQIVRALQIYRRDPWLAGYRSAPESGHDELAAVARVQTRMAALEPLALPPRSARVPLDAIAETLLLARGGDPQPGASPRHHYRVEILGSGASRREIDVHAADARKAGSAALAIACAELQNLMVFLVRRDPDPERLGWADALLGYLCALTPSSRNQAIGLLAGAG